MFAVDFGFSFELVILENVEIDPKIMEIVWVRSLYWQYYSNCLYKECSKTTTGKLHKKNDAI